MGAEATPGKTRKRSNAKATNSEDAAKEKVTLYLPVELARRFSVHVAYSGMDRSQFFAEMVRQHCRRYVVSDRLKEPAAPAQAKGEGEEEADAEAE